MFNFFNLIFPIVILVLFLSASLSTRTSGVKLHQDPINPAECDPVSITISISVENEDYDMRRFWINQGACLLLIFTNTGTLGHDFTIDHPNGDGYWVYLPIHDDLPSTRALTAKIQMPYEDLSFEFYCSLAGHNHNGGVIIVGDQPDPEPTVNWLNHPFIVPAVMVGFGLYFFIYAIRKQNRRK